MMSAPPLALGFRCPKCAGVFEWNGAHGRCLSCGQPASTVGAQIADFLGGGNIATAEAILGWSSAFVERVERTIGALQRHQKVPPQVLDDLVVRGVADELGRFTPLGEGLAYHLAETARQSDETLFGEFRDRMNLGPSARLLDIGCGAGQTLRSLDGEGLALRAGVDIDLDALAFGWVYNAWNDARVVLIRASAHELPFAPGAFSHVICRVGLNYMHQKTALREMARVLEPGGWLYARVEGPGFDLKLAGQARGARHRASRIADLALGAVHACTGRQPTPGSRFGGGRAFATPGRLAAILSRAGCRVVSVNPTSRGALGLPMGFDILASRAASPGNLRPGP